jgi:hypothetical protein
MMGGVSNNTLEHTSVCALTLMKSVAEGVGKVKNLSPVIVPPQAKVRYLVALLALRVALSRVLPPSSDSWFLALV